MGTEERELIRRAAALLSQARTLAELDAAWTQLAARADGGRLCKILHHYYRRLREGFA